MKILIPVLFLFSASVNAATPGACETKSSPRGTIRQDCAVPMDKGEHSVRVTSELTAIYSNYETSRSTGIRVKFYSLKALMRTVDLDFNGPASETADKVTVALSKVVPMGSPVEKLEFDGVEASQSLTLRIMYLNENNALTRVDVFSAE